MQKPSRHFLLILNNLSFASGSMAIYPARAKTASHGSSNHLLWYPQWFSLHFFYFLSKFQRVSKSYYLGFIVIVTCIAKCITLNNLSGYHGIE